MQFKVSDYQKIPTSTQDKIILLEGPVHCIFSQVLTALGWKPCQHQVHDDNDEMVYPIIRVGCYLGNLSLFFYIRFICFKLNILLHLLPSKFFFPLTNDV